jgi:hypothetical protein
MNSVTLHKSLLPVLGESAQSSVEHLWNVLESAPYGNGPDCLPLVSLRAHRSKYTDGHSMPLSGFPFLNDSLEQGHRCKNEEAGRWIELDDGME